MIGPSLQIETELEARKKRLGLLLDSIQYELLRLRGMSTEEVEEFEKTLQQEISTWGHKDPMFIEELWVERRVQGYAYDQIEYDWVHAVL